MWDLRIRKVWNMFKIKLLGMGFSFFVLCFGGYTFGCVIGVIGVGGGIVFCVRD